MAADWDTVAVWRRQIERRLAEIGSQVRGNTEWQAGRVADLIEQIDELRQALKQVTERQERMAAFLNKLKEGRKEEHNGTER